MEDRCVCCGEIVPEGRMVCYMCQHSLDREKEDDRKRVTISLRRKERTGSEKKISKKEMQKLEKQMRISHVVHDRPPVGRTAVFFGKTNKQLRRESKNLIRRERY